MIYDCFTFYNELDLLEIRLNVLDSIVDKFVLVEETRTQNNQEKELYYLKNRDRFKKFNDKIIHVVLDEYPQEISQWTIENLQRNKINDGLVNCKDDDIIMISDLDEIPNPDVVLKVKDKPGIKALNMRTFFYYLNFEAKDLTWDHATKILYYKDFKNILYNEVCVNCLDSLSNCGTTASKIRLYYGDKQKHYPDAGWHFTWCGNATRIKQKLNSVCEGDANVGLDYAKKLLESSCFAQYKLTPVKIDKTFPKYIKKNKKKYNNLILKFIYLSENFKILKLNEKIQIYINILGLKIRHNIKNKGE